MGAYAVVTSNETVEARCLPLGTTSQKAELIALTRALQLAANKRATIYTDCKCAFLIAHSHSAIWHERGFLTTKGSPIVKAKLIITLLQALQLPTEVAIVQCRGHQQSTDLIAQGNARADRVARGLTQTHTVATALYITPSLAPKYSAEKLTKLQEKGGETTPQGWITLNSLIALPSLQPQEIITGIHNTLHIGPEALYRFLQPLFFFPTIRSVIKRYTNSVPSVQPPRHREDSIPGNPPISCRDTSQLRTGRSTSLICPLHKKYRFILRLIPSQVGSRPSRPLTRWRKRLPRPSYRKSFPASASRAPSSQITDPPSPLGLSNWWRRH